jgi:hypothetical protein
MAIGKDLPAAPVFAPLGFLVGLADLDGPALDLGAV